MKIFLPIKTSLGWTGTCTKSCCKGWVPESRRTPTTERDALPAGLKLAITLRYLASGDSYKSLHYAFRVPHNSISLLVRETCKAIIEKYQDEVLKCLRTPEEWLEVEKEFYRKGAFPNVIGCIDGNHIAIQKPAKSGSLYYNYKKFFSIVMLALVYANLKFLWVDIGSNGACSDAQIFNDSLLKRAIEDGTINFPEATALPGEETRLPYCILGDDAFALRTWLMKPHSKRNLSREERAFNKRLSRVRIFVEHSFGVLANRFRCLLTTMRQRTQTVRSIVFTTVILHNIIRSRYQQDHQRQDPDNNQPTNRNLEDMDDRQNTNSGTDRAKRQRQYLTDYLNSPEAMHPWQYQ